VVGRRELDARHDEDERGAEAEAGEASEYQTVEIVSGSDGGEANKSSRENQETGEQRTADGSEPHAPVTPTNGGQTRDNPEWQSTDGEEEWILFE
jgi:hypothetical protein